MGWVEGGHMGWLGGVVWWAAVGAGGALGGVGVGVGMGVPGVPGVGVEWVGGSVGGMDSWVRCCVQFFPCWSLTSA